MFVSFFFDDDRINRIRIRRGMQTRIQTVYDTFWKMCVIYIKFAVVQQQQQLNREF